MLLLIAVVTAFTGHRQLRLMAGNWDGYWREHEAQLFQELKNELTDLLERGESAARELALLGDRSEGLPPARRLEDLRSRTDFPAVAIFGPDGRALVWTGTHRGLVPEEARFGSDRLEYVYGELPLFSHLYFTTPLPSTGGTAVVVALLRADLPGEQGAVPSDFVSRFRRRNGAEIRISSPERASERAVYDLTWNDTTLFSLSVVRPGEAIYRARVEAGWIRVLATVLASAWLLFALAGVGDRRHAAAAALTLIGLAALLPWDVLIGEATLLRPADFLLPLPGRGMTGGRLLAVALAGTVAAGLLPASGDGRFPAPFVGLSLALTLPIVVDVVGRGGSAGLLAGPYLGWGAYQMALAVPLALLVSLALVLSRPLKSRLAPAPVLVGALILALLLAAALAWGARTRLEVSSWMAAAWALPAFGAASVVGRWTGWRRAFFLWLTSAVVGASLALPYAWSFRTAARMTVAESQLERLGADVDPYLRFQLGRFSTTVDSLYQRGAGPVELLYRGWVNSGFAREGYPLWLTLWSPGNLPRDEFRIGVRNEPRPTVVAGLLEETRRRDTVVIRRFEQLDARYVVSVPLPGGLVVTGVVPPPHAVGAEAPLRRLFGSLSGEPPDPVTLVPLLAGEVLRAGLETRWTRTPEGWRGERGVVYPDQAYNASYPIDLPGAPMLWARATLLLTLDLALVLALWALGRLLAQGMRPVDRGWRGLFTSFRARVTAALFGFFLLSNAIFGTLAFRNISGAAQRAAQVLAERMAEDAALVYLEERRMELLSTRVGGELLEYRNGELREGPQAELVELGLYEGWLPFDVYQSLSTGESLLSTRVSSLGRWEYVTAFRRLPDGDILAVPVPLQAGATAVRREDVAYVLAFVTLAGAALSLVLALLVGRTLTRPIHTLQVASERVGRGNLGVRLPSGRSDEFGAVFSAFNRMVRRLRKTHRQLVRMTRRTQAIVEDAATGVIALDSMGRVTVVNPRAERLLGGSVEVGRPLADTEGPAGELVQWVHRYFRDRLREVAAEFQFDERRIRVRARRISRGTGTLAGAVLSLEDVTDELRTERILAWGEMARQVAHEVKNPLTPIKLSIQHIRRAWEDRRSNFGDILTKNADAMLKEIDRLAAIAASFSRFGAPRAAGQQPLEAVDLEDLVDEVLALYESGEGGVRFEKDIPMGLPPVSARESEMKEVLINLLENARAAIPEEGWVRVEARPSGPDVTLAVRDNGSGIAPELQARIFEPRFSTRSTGTGLGLAIVRRVVESWNAQVSVESWPGEGTVIHLWLAGWNGDGGGEARSWESEPEPSDEELGA